MADGGQMVLAALPVADPQWEARLEAERRAEERQREREELQRVVVAMADSSDFFGYVSTIDVLEEVEPYARYEGAEARVAFRAMAVRLRDLAERGMIEHLRPATRGRQEPALWAGVSHG